MRLVLDCNVMVSAARSHGTCRSVVHAVAAGHEVIWSEGILGEYARVIARPKHLPFLQPMTELLERLQPVARLVIPIDLTTGLPDPKDEIYLATALAANADGIVTGNLRDFPADVCAPVAIWSPAELLRRT